MTVREARESSKAVAERFSLFDLFEGTRRLVVDGRERKERAAKDLEPRRTCSVGEGWCVSG